MWKRSETRIATIPLAFRDLKRRMWKRSETRIATIHWTELLFPEHYTVIFAADCGNEFMHFLTKSKLTAFHFVWCINILSGICPYSIVWKADHSQCATSSVMSRRYTAVHGRNVTRRWFPVSLPQSRIHYLGVLPFCYHLPTPIVTQQLKCWCVESIDHI